MKEIFERIKDREWDWFNRNRSFKSMDYNVVKAGLIFFPQGKGPGKIWELESIANLLANKSWCKAVWGEEDFLSHKKWQAMSRYAFNKLQQEGEEACIEYITETMV